MVTLNGDLKNNCHNIFKLLPSMHSVILYTHKYTQPYMMFPGEIPVRSDKNRTNLLRLIIKRLPWDTL